VRAANRFLKAQGTCPWNTLYDAFSRPDNGRMSSIGWARRDLPGTAAVFSEHARLARQLPHAMSRRNVHAQCLASARADLFRWRQMGGFLP
jgi:hypothetical protein